MAPSRFFLKFLYFYFIRKAERERPIFQLPGTLQMPGLVMVGKRQSQVPGSPRVYYMGVKDPIIWAVINFFPGWEVESGVEYRKVWAAQVPS